MKKISKQNNSYKFENDLVFKNPLFTFYFHYSMSNFWKGSQKLNLLKIYG